MAIVRSSFLVIWSGNTWSGPGTWGASCDFRHRPVGAAPCGPPQGVPMIRSDSSRPTGRRMARFRHRGRVFAALAGGLAAVMAIPVDRKEHTSELQSRQYLVCRLLLEKKKN